MSQRQQQQEQRSESIRSQFTSSMRTSSAAAASSSSSAAGGTAPASMSPPQQQSPPPGNSRGSTTTMTTTTTRTTNSTSTLRGLSGAEQGHWDTLRSEHAPGAFRTPVPDTSMAHDMPSNTAYFEQLEELLLERLKAAEDTARAVASTREIVNLDTMLSRAKSAGVQSAATRISPLISSLSPIEIQSVIAERDELRRQLNEAAAQVRKVLEGVVGASPVEVTRKNQQDMERMARLRSHVELEQDQLRIRLKDYESVVSESRSQLDVHSMHISTAEEQLAERAEVILRLNEQIRSLQDEVERVRSESKTQLERELVEQRDRIWNEAAHEKRLAMEDLESRLQKEARQELTDLRFELEHRADTQLATKLSEQRHSLLSQAAREKAEELQALQSELHQREAANLEALRQQAQRDKDQAIMSIKTQHTSIQERLEQELEGQRHQAELDIAEALDDQKRRLLSDFKNEKRNALEQLEETLKAKHLADLDNLKRTLERKHQQNLDSVLKNELEKQRRALTNKFNKEKADELGQQAAEMKHERKEALARLQMQLSTQHKAELDGRVAKAVETERKKLQREAARDKAATVEHVISDFRAEKASALTTVKTRIGKSADAKAEAMQEQIVALQGEISRLRRSQQDVTRMTTTKQKLEKRYRLILLERLRELLSNMKQTTGAKQRHDAPMDLSSSSPSPAIGSLAALISGLAATPPDVSALGEPSYAACSAPVMSFDVLYLCAEELCHMLRKAEQEIEALQHQLHREHVLVRKQVEDDVADERRHELHNARAQYERELADEIQRRMVTIGHQHDLELKRMQLQHEEELRRYQVELEAKTHADSQMLAKTLSEETARERRNRQEKENELNKEVRGKSALKEKLDNQSLRVNALEQENSALKKDLKAAMKRLKDAQAQAQASPMSTADSGLSKTLGSGSNQAELQQLRKDRRLYEMERLRLEKMVVDLRRHLREVSARKSAFTDDPDCY